MNETKYFCQFTKLTNQAKTKMTWYNMLEGCFYMVLNKYFQDIIAYIS